MPALLASLALAAFLQAAQTGPPPPQPGPAAAPPENGSVAGNVTNSLTGEPLKKARVTLRRSGMVPAGSAVPATVSVNSDEAGHFEFLDVPPGDCQLTASRTGFAGLASASGSASGVTLRIALAPGERAVDLKLRLIPQGVISGRVVDENGEPARNVSVYATRPSYSQGVRRLASAGVQSGSTNDLGEYRIYGLTPARYYVRALPAPVTAGSTGLPDAANRTYPEVYYPSVASLDAATRVEVRAGAEVGGINFTLHPAPAVKARGRVLDAATGQPPQRARVMAYPAGAVGLSGMGASASPDAKGEFEIGHLLPGSYVLIATASLANRAISARETVEVGESGLTGVQLLLTAGAEVAGTVRADGAPAFDLSKLRVSLRSRESGASVGSVPAGVNIMFTMTSSGPAPPQADSAAKIPGAVAPSGEFALPDVSASRYEAYVSGLPEAFYLKSVSVAGQETIDSGFDVNGTGRYRLDLVLSGDGAQVEGQVLDSNDKPAGGAMVALVPADAALRSASRLYKNATTAQDGKFALKSIPPGKYRIYAWEGIEDGAWYDPDFIGRYENQGESASFESGERKTMSLRLTSTTEGPSR